MDYAKFYKQCCLKEPNRLEKFFMNLLTKKAREAGQETHQAMPLKYIIENFAVRKSPLTVLDVGAYDGWFLSYQSPMIERKIAIDFDNTFAEELKKKNIEYLNVDVEKEKLPLPENTVDATILNSTLEHLSNVDFVVGELYRVSKKGGIVYVEVPDIMKDKFHFWDDITHATPFTMNSLRFLFEANGFEIVRLHHYNHNFFQAGFLLPKVVQEKIMTWGDRLFLIARK